VHARDDGVHPLDQGRRLGAGIPGAELATLESPNHVLVPQEPAWQVFFARVEAFAAA
jgi:pimeloyl-ACP methyl ester carboxylesterase